MVAKKGREGVEVRRKRREWEKEKKTLTIEREKPT